MERFNDENGFLAVDDEERKSYFLWLQEKVRMGNQVSILGGKSRGAAVMLQFVLCLHYGLKSESESLRNVISDLVMVADENDKNLGVTKEMSDLMHRILEP